jgi:hypothetical protein
MSLSERRVQGRFLCAELVHVTWLEGEKEARSKTLDAVLEDISALGACVEVEEAIPLDARITLTIGEARFSGRVAYSVFRDYGFFVGIRFSEHNVWSSAMVMPQHLTNLNSLMERPDPSI